LDQRIFDIAKKYRAGSTNIARLSEKIIKGGGGVWGEQAMAAHPQVSNADAREMVQYILSLSDAKKASLPAKGSYATEEKAKDGTYIFSAVYTDKGANGVSPQSGESTVVLRSNKVKASTFDTQKEMMKLNVAQAGGDVAIATTDKCYAGYNDIDLTGIGSVSLTAIASDERTAGGKIELRLDSPTGTLVGEVEVTKAMKPLKITTAGQKGVHNLYLVFSNPDAKGKALMAVLDMTFNKE
jgi:cytochrome c